MSAGTVKRLAIVPARGGSKRIPRKNIRPFLGEPIIVRVLREIAASELFSSIHVSTDDVEIADIAASAGFPPAFMRPVELATDDVPLRDVLIDVVENYQRGGQRFETIALIFATAVLIDRDILIDAIRVFEQGRRDAQLLSVAALPVPIHRALIRDENDFLHTVHCDVSPEQSAYFETGDFVIYSEEEVFRNSAHSKRRGFVLPPWLAVDIDTEDDWESAKRLYERKHSR